MLFGQEHVQQYIDTDGAVGHDWQGSTVLILTTQGRRSGQPRTTPLIYQPYRDDHLVIASKGGSDDPSNLWALCFDCNRGKRDECL